MRLAAYPDDSAAPPRALACLWGPAQRLTRWVVERVDRVLFGGEGLEDEGSAAHAGLIRSRAGNLLTLADRRVGKDMA
jgi:hypothetical protein